MSGFHSLFGGAGFGGDFGGGFGGGFDFMFTLVPIFIGIIFVIVIVGLIGSGVKYVQNARSPAKPGMPASCPNGWTSGTFHQATTAIIICILPRPGRIITLRWNSITANAWSTLT